MCRKRTSSALNAWTGTRRILALLSGCLVLAGTILGVEPGPLPVFNVQRMDGSAAKSSDWTLQGKWLLIYAARGSDGLLRRLTQPEYPQLASRTIIVGGGMQLEGAQGFQKKFPDLAAAAWYVDTSGSASNALNLHGAPVILGIQDGVVHWRINGLPADRKLMHSLLTTWLTQ